MKTFSLCCVVAGTLALSVQSGVLASSEGKTHPIVSHLELIPHGGAALRGSYTDPRSGLRVTVSRTTGTSSLDFCHNTITLSVNVSLTVRNPSSHSINLQSLSLTAHTGPTWVNKHGLVPQGPSLTMTVPLARGAATIGSRSTVESTIPFTWHHARNPIALHLALTAPATPRHVIANYIVRARVLWFTYPPKC